MDLAVPTSDLIRMMDAHLALIGTDVEDWNPLAAPAGTFGKEQA